MSRVSLLPDPRKYDGPIGPLGSFDQPDSGGTGIAAYGTPAIAVSSQLRPRILVEQAIALDDAGLARLRHLERLALQARKLASDAVMADQTTAKYLDFLAAQREVARVQEGVDWLADRLQAEYCERAEWAEAFEETPEQAETRAAVEADISRDLAPERRWAPHPGDTGAFVPYRVADAHRVG